MTVVGARRGRGASRGCMGRTREGADRGTMHREHEGDEHGVRCTGSMKGRDALTSNNMICSLQVWYHLLCTLGAAS